MSEELIPQNLGDYLDRKLAGLHPNARLVFVLDPRARLALPPEVTVGGQAWPVHRYEGNDLNLRARLAGEGWTAVGTGRRGLVWVTAPRGWEPGTEVRIRLSSLADLLALADEILDLSLVGVLAELVPGESWPADALARHEDAFAANLPVVVSGRAELRRHLARGAVLDVHAVRALALHLTQPELPASDFLFHRDSPEKVLHRYVRLAWDADWDEQGQGLLREQARSSSQVALGPTAAWFQPTVDMLAIYLYVRRLLGRAGVSHIANQVRGLGLLDFDPEPLEAWVETVLLRWDREPAWRGQVIAKAEDRLSESDLQKIAAILPARTAEDLWAVIETVETPGAVYESARRLLRDTPDAELDTTLKFWPAHRPKGGGTEHSTCYRAAAEAITAFLDETAGVLSALASRTNPPPSVSGTLDWYVAGSYYDLEFACARAASQLRRIPDRNLERRMQSYLDGLRGRVREFLGQADQWLAEQIAPNVGKYLNDPRLSTHVLWDLVKQRRLRPKPESPLWVVVFDGMRWDTWQRVVKPRLLEVFEMKTPEKPYLSLLPSWTPIARTGLLAGRQPAEWQGTRDQKLLVARLFEIPAGERENQLQFYSGMESDRTYRQLDRDHSYPWNVLIFNISDDGLHQERGDLVALNSKIKTQLDDVVQTLIALVGGEDTVVISSDHGFVELDNDEHGIVIQEDQRLQRQAAGDADPVRFRYMIGISHPEGVTVQHGGTAYTVAVGQRWFRRADGRTRAPDRYAHGGLSLAEMVVPGVAMKRIVEKRVQLEMTEPSVRAVSVAEDEPLEINIVLENRGNQETAFSLQVRADTDSAPQSVQGKVAPTAQWTGGVTVHPIYRERGGSTKSVKLTLRYTDARGQSVTRYADISVEIVARRDRVEIEFGGLDELDDLA